MQGLENLVGSVFEAGFFRVDCEFRRFRFFIWEGHTGEIVNFSGLRLIVESGFVA